MAKSTKKIVLLISVVILLVGGYVVYYQFNLPHRNVQATKTDFSLNATELVTEYLSNAEVANKKYLQEEGDSKVLAVKGNIFSISEDLKNQKVILLKDASQKAGVSCTFTAQTNTHTNALKVGQVVTIKGVIRSGATYDKDMELYEDVIMEKCDLINN